MLPGKLCIGILEEDNPLKSYFRIKPLIILENGKYEVFNTPEIFPSDGCLRIVPDKNESGRFKARMRRMGRYCLLDLRSHPTANDKIRTNKNFGAIPGERNANIVYSDVVREPMEGMILDIATDPRDETVTTEQILIGDGNEVYSYVMEASGEGAYAAPNGMIIEEDEIVRFSLTGSNGRPLRFAVRTSDAYIPAPFSAPAEQPAHKPVFDAPAAPIAAETSNEAPTEPKPAPVEAVPSFEATTPEQSASPAPAVPQPPIEGAPSVRRFFASQAGLNPRGRMTLQEIIDDKWCRSRLEQLGQPIPGEAMGKPVENPVDSAIRAIRCAWDNPETRRQLANEIIGMNDIADVLDEQLRNSNQAAVTHALEELEADRLRALAEIDQLRKDKAALRETFKDEIRSDEAKAFADAVAKTNAAKKHLAELRAQVEAVRGDADAMRDLLASLNDGRFEAELRAFALKNRCMETIMKMRCGDPCPAPVPECAPDRAEWIARVRSVFADHGLPIDDITAADLLVSVALSDSVILSGPSGSDRRLWLDALADALGASAVDRVIPLEPDPRHPLLPHLRDKLHAECDVAGLLVVNATDPMSFHCPPASRSAGFITVFNVSDTDSMIAPEAAETGCFIRLTPPASDAPWHSPACDSSAPMPTASLASLRDAFLSDLAEVPAEAVETLNALRRKLADCGVHLSRGVLNDMWKYCTSMLSAVPISAVEALDRAFAHRALISILSAAPIACLKSLSEILVPLPICASLLKQPLPIGI